MKNKITFKSKEEFRKNPTSFDDSKLPKAEIFKKDLQEISYIINQGQQIVLRFNK